MNALSRNDFTLRDPSALGALLGYDWRLRGVLTDDELISAVDRPVTTGVLRHIQRLNFIRSIHGVRPQGGRMRLWPLEEAIRVQVVLDLREATCVRLASCVETLMLHRVLTDDAIQNWESHIDSCDEHISNAAQYGDGKSLLQTPEELNTAICASVCAFVRRNAFASVSQPSFLLQ